MSARLARSLSPLPLLLLACVVVAIASTARADADSELLAKLESTRLDVNYAPEDLTKIIEDLRSKHGLNVQVAWSRLDAGGIRKDRRIEIRLTNVPLTVLLDNLVRELDPESDSFGWGVDQGVVLITTRNALSRRALLRAYDVRDLLESGYALRRFANTPVLALDTTGREFVGGEQDDKLDELAKLGGGGFGGGSGGGGGIFGSPGEDPSRMELIERLVDLISENVAPDTWRDAGGDTGQITVLHGALLIRQTLQAHNAIADLLALMRSVEPKTVLLDAAIVRLSSQRAATVRQAARDSFPVVTNEIFTSLGFAADSDGVLFRASSAGRNGSAIWISDVGQTSVISRIDGLVAQQTSALLPRLGSLFDGIELIVLPLLEPNGSAAALDVQMAWKPDPEIQVLEGMAPNASRERMRTVSASVRVPLGQAVALSVSARPNSDGASMEHEDWLIVRLRAAP